MGRFLVAFFAVVSVVAAQECPETDPSTPVFLPHPTNCSKYYECSNGKAIEMECPPDEYFDPEKLRCDWKENVECKTESANKQNAFVYSSNEDPVQALECVDETVEYFPHEDCHLYYQCSNGMAVLQECPPDLHFNLEKNVCDRVKDANCKKKE